MPEPLSPDWHEIRHAARAGKSAPEWPSGVRQISLEGLQLLGIDDDHQLYWDGQRVEVRRRFTLSFWQKLGAVIVAIGTLIGGVGALAQGAVATVDFACEHRLRVNWCADAQPLPSPVLFDPG